MKRFKVVYRFQSWPLEVVNRSRVVDASSIKAARTQVLTNDGLIVITIRRVDDKEV